MLGICYDGLPVDLYRKADAIELNRSLCEDANSASGDSEYLVAGMYVAK